MDRLTMEFIDKVAQYRTAIKEIQKLSVDDVQEITVLRNLIKKLESEIDEFITDFFFN